MFNGRGIHLGRFTNIADAVSAREKANESLNFSGYHGTDNPNKTPKTLSGHLRVNNSSGHVGVRYSGKHWKAKIGVGGREYHLGTFDTKEEAIAARRADALERIADHFLSSDESAATGGDRCTLHIHTDMNTLKADGDGAESELAEGGNVSAETSRRLACDCGVVPKAVPERAAAPVPVPSAFTAVGVRVSTGVSSSLTGELQPASTSAANDTRLVERMFVRSPIIFITPRSWMAMGHPGAGGMPARNWGSA